MRYLGIDYGEKRIGLALSDEGGGMAFPYRVLEVKRKDGVAKEVLKVIADKKVRRIVVGLPRLFDGRVSLEEKKVRAFVQRFKKEVKLPIEFENEALTTRWAERSSPREKAHASAAALILQSYLDRLKSEARNPKS